MSLKSLHTITKSIPRSSPASPSSSSIRCCQDLDFYVSVGLQPVSEGYPSRHSLQTSMLAVSIGTIMGLSREELLELSSRLPAARRRHDARPAAYSSNSGPLSTSDRLEVLKHPLYIANALNDRNDIPHGAKATAYQIHERMNGSGYPRQAAASADSSVRPHRRPSPTPIWR